MIKMSLAVVCMLIALQSSFAASLEFAQIKWLQGAKDCTRSQEPKIQVQQLNEDTFILRESPCVDPEAPFMYLIFGKSKVLLQDTGMIPDNLKDPSSFPLQASVQQIIDEWKIRHRIQKLELLVTHSHSHNDHTSGDYQFAGRPDTTMVGTSLKDVIQFYGFNDWPHHSAQLNLGGRLLEIIPIPGHHQAHIAIYDYQTGFLLTGDTLYPGRLYIEDWNQYKASIATLVEFSESHTISYILGNHIEMTTEPYTDFRFEVTDRKFQHSLQLQSSQLLQLNRALEMLSDEPRKKAYPDFIIEPLS